MTIGLPLGHVSQDEISSQVELLVAASQQVLASGKISVRTLRFTLPKLSPDDFLEGSIRGRLDWVDELASSNGVRWACLPLDLTGPSNSKEMLREALTAMVRFPRLFANLIVADTAGISMAGVEASSGFILDLSKKSSSGYDNFRVGVSMNCGPNAPFFPASRHEGNNVSFSFALETTGLVRDVLLQNDAVGSSDLMFKRDLVVETLVPAFRDVEQYGRRLSELSGAEYSGLDASLAPFPTGDSSVAGVIELLLGAPLGSEGTLLATSLLSDALRQSVKRAEITSLGFNGVMLSVLEDSLLAEAFARREMNLGDLLSLSAVCGCGIDMVPISGYSFVEQIAGVILDVAGLSSTLGKPLEVRLLPIPNKLENEFTEFNMDFLCDSRIVGLGSAGNKILGSKDRIKFDAPLHGGLFLD